MEDDDMPPGPPPLVRSAAFRGIRLQCSQCNKEFKSLINGKCDMCTANQNDGRRRRSKKRRSKKRRSKKRRSKKKNY